MAEAVAVAALPALLSSCHSCCCPCCARRPEKETPPAVQVHVVQTVGGSNDAPAAAGGAAGPDVWATMMDEVRHTLSEVRRDMTEAHRRRVSQQFHDRMQHHLEALRRTWSPSPGTMVPGGLSAAPSQWQMPRPQL